MLISFSNVFIAEQVQNAVSLSAELSFPRNSLMRLPYSVAFIVRTCMVYYLQASIISTPWGKKKKKGALGCN